MCQSHTLCRVCYKVSCYKRVLHTLMSHSDTITYSDSWEHNRCSTCHSYAHLYCVCYLIKIHMSWNYLIIRAYDTNKWLLELFLCKSKSIKQRTVRSLLHPRCYIITSHIYYQAFLYFSLEALTDSITHI